MLAFCVTFRELCFDTYPNTQVFCYIMTLVNLDGVAFEIQLKLYILAVNFAAKVEDIVWWVSLYTSEQCLMMSLQLWEQEKPISKDCSNSQYRGIL
jgi:hypothetical protein